MRSHAILRDKQQLKVSLTDEVPKLNFLKLVLKWAIERRTSETLRIETERRFSNTAHWLIGQCREERCKKLRQLLN